MFAEWARKTWIRKKFNFVIIRVSNTGYDLYSQLCCLGHRWVPIIISTKPALMTAACRIGTGEITDLWQFMLLTFHVRCQSPLKPLLFVFADSLFQVHEVSRINTSLCSVPFTLTPCLGVIVTRSVIIVACLPHPNWICILEHYNGLWGLNIWMCFKGCCYW